jgi:hypothetical protein
MNQRKRKHTYAAGGYGKPPRRVFVLAPHHYLLPAPFLDRYNSDPYFDVGLKPLRAPDGRLVARRHGDLKPGEVSLVLE